MHMCMYYIYLYRKKYEVNEPLCIARVASLLIYHQREHLFATVAVVVAALNNLMTFVA